MGEYREPVTIRRIVVAVDASPHSRAAMEAAVLLAARFDAELLGLFVEDINVLRIAGLPYAQEFGVYSAQRRQINTADVERQLRVRSRQVQHSFRLLAERESIQGTFRVTRGSVGKEIQSAAADADVLIVGRVGWSQLRERQVGSTTRAICCGEAPSVTAVLLSGAQLAPPVLVVYDASAAAEKALVFAGGLIGETGGALEVLLVADTELLLQARRNLLERALTELKVMKHQQHILITSVLQNLIRAIHVLHAQTVVLPASLSLLQDGRVVSLLEQVDIPVLLVR